MPESRRWTGSVAGAFLRVATLVSVVIGMVVVSVAAPTAPPAAAYNVCSDDGAPCVHEYMAGVAMSIFNTQEILDFADDIQAGATHEDELDHVYSLSHIGGALITITHFWDADVSDSESVDNILGSFPNSWQKVQALWSMALGAYAKGDKEAAYHWLGHVVHLIGDHTIPTHVHEDMHGPDFVDDDAYEEWMSVPSATPGLPLNAQVTQAEVSGLISQGPIEVPADVDPVYYLLYTTNQIADFFASEVGPLDIGDSAEENGDTFDRHGWVQAELDSMDAAISSPRTFLDLIDNDIEIPGIKENNNDDDGDLSRIRQYSYLRGIRAIAGLYKVWNTTITNQVSVAVVIDHIEEDEDHDYACGPIPVPPFEACVETSDPDFFARAVFPGRAAMNRGDEIVDDEVVDPGWAFGHTVPLTGSIPIHLEIWDHDGTGEDVITLSGKDDQSDIDPTGDGGDLDLDVSVDLAACLARAPGAITGEATGACGDTLISTGDDDVEASQVRFRIIMSKSPPTAEAGGPYTTTEGTDAALDGSASTDPDNDIVSYAWDLDGDGACDDVANDSTPDFTTVGQDGVTTVKLCVTDALGLTAEDTATVTVNNVSPSITLASNAPRGENTAVTVTGTISDPGWLDPLSGTISWGDGSPPEALTGNLDNTRPDATLTFSASHTYGDNGTFTAQVCAADDDTQPCTTLALQIDNTDPTATIDLAGAVSVNGTPTVIAHAGEPVDFNGRVTDPGSDDLTLTWAWGDGTADATLTSLVNPPNPDPALSPSIQPRDVSFPQTHTFNDACVYETTLAAADDDGGSDQSTANVIIVGNGSPNHPHGWWKQQFRHYVVGHGPSNFTTGQLDCYLAITGYMSGVFTEVTAAATLAEAYDVLDTSQTSVMTELFDLQLLAAWLNFANGAIEWDRLVDTNGDRTPDTRFLDAITAAETLRLDPASTRTQLDRQLAIIERWTNLP